MSAQWKALKWNQRLGRTAPVIASDWNKNKPPCCRIETSQTSQETSILTTSILTLDPNNLNLPLDCSLTAYTLLEKRKVPTPTDFSLKTS